MMRQWATGHKHFVSLCSCLHLFARTINSYRSSSPANNTFSSIHHLQRQWLRSRSCLMAQTQADSLKISPWLLRCQSHKTHWGKKRCNSQVNIAEILKYSCWVKKGIHLGKSKQRANIQRSALTNSSLQQKHRHHSFQLESCVYRSQIWSTDQKNEM